MTWSTLFYMDVIWYPCHGLNFGSANICYWKRPLVWTYRCEYVKWSSGWWFLSVEGRGKTVHKYRQNTNQQWIQYVWSNTIYWHFFLSNQGACASAAMTSCAQNIPVSAPERSNHYTSTFNAQVRPIKSSRGAVKAKFPQHQRSGISLPRRTLTWINQAIMVMRTHVCSLQHSCIQPVMSLTQWSWLVF